MSSCDCQDNFIFEGSKPACVQGRLVNSHINVHEKTLVVKEYELLSEGDSNRPVSAKHPQFKKETILQLPDEFGLETVVGTVICIGCAGDLLIFQYVSSEKRAYYVKFLVGDTSSMKMFPFDDTHRFFNRDSAVVAPLECLISPDKQVCLLRLPQSILSPKKWSKLLMCKKLEETEPIGLSNPITGTVPSRFRDRKFQLIAFDPHQSSQLVMVLLDSYCSKCKISVHDFVSNKELLQCSRKLPKQSPKHPDSQSDMESDSDDEVLFYCFLQDCSLVYSRSGETFMITCILTDNMDNTFCQMFFFNSANFSIVGFQTFRSEMFPMKKSEMLVPVLSPCDSQVMFWLVEKRTDHFVELYQCNIPRPINLKSFCRSVIIRNLKKHVSRCLDLPLPSSLIKYLQFIYCKSD